MNNWIGPTVKHVWNIAMHMLEFFSLCQKHNSLSLGPIQPESASTKELHSLAS